MLTKKQLAGNPREMLEDMLIKLSIQNERLKTETQILRTDCANMSHKLEFARNRHKRFVEKVEEKFDNLENELSMFNSVCKFLAVELNKRKIFTRSLFTTIDN